MSETTESLEQFALRAYSGSIPPEKLEMLALMRANPLPDPQPGQSAAEFLKATMQAWYRTLTPTEQANLRADVPGWTTDFGIAP